MSSVFKDARGASVSHINKKETELMDSVWKNIYSGG